VEVEVVKLVRRGCGSSAGTKAIRFGMCFEGRIHKICCWAQYRYERGKNPDDMEVWGLSS
jgi:hypothetical protein